MLSDPHLWSTLVELELEDYRITRGVNRFRLVAGRPSPNVAVLVSDIIVSSRGYDTMKKAAISQTAPTDQLIRQLPQGSELGNKFPEKYCGGVKCQ